MKPHVSTRKFPVSTAVGLELKGILVTHKKCWAKALALVSKLCVASALGQKNVAWSMACVQIWKKSNSEILSVPDVQISIYTK